MKDIDLKLGKSFVNNLGNVGIVTSIENSRNIEIYFETGNTAVFTHAHLKRGSFKNKLYPSVYGVGFIGDGPFSIESDLYVYKKWQSMLQRCYDPKFQKRSPTYIGCTVKAVWHNFQNFASWFYGQEPICQNTLYTVDKDLIIMNNKVYSPEACELLPQIVNSAIALPKLSNKELPIGVIWHSSKKEYRAQMVYINENGVKKNKHTYTSKTDIEACFLSYKKTKENHYREVATKYKSVITERAFQAIYNRIVYHDHHHHNLDLC